MTAPTGKLLTHKNRVLLLEWRGRMREATELGVRVSLGWMRGHTDRKDWPYPVQAWCDEFAVAANRGGAEVEEAAREVSQWEGPFVLWDEREQRPVWGGWQQELARRLRAEAAERARGSDSLAAGSIGQRREGGWRRSGMWCSARGAGNRSSRRGREASWRTFSGSA
jgi:hypothetical protein